MELKEIASLKIKIVAFKKSISKSKEIELIKLQIKEIANSSNFNELSNKYRNKPALIIQESSSKAKTTIYWKSAEIEEFLALKPNEKLKIEAVRKLNEFIVDFLINSIKNNQLGNFLYNCESKIQILSNSNLTFF